MNFDRRMAIIMGGVLFTAFIFLIIQIIPGNEPVTSSSATSEETTITMEKKVKEPDLAGTGWYPGDREDLKSMLDSFLSNARKEDINIRALICAHAGYMASGQTAAFSYKQLEGTTFKKAIILAPSHSHPIHGGVVSDYTHFDTPLGELKVSPLNEEMLRNSLIAQDNAPFSQENSIEVQLPYLKKVMPDIEIVPIIIGQMSKEEIRQLAEFLSGYLNQDTVLLTSTDLSHYHPYDEAVSLDRESIDAILALDFNKVARGEMCGLFPVLITVEIAKLKNWKTRLLHYENSGDVFGDRSRVVGYLALAFYTDRESREESPGPLNKSEQHYLLNLARETVEEYVRDRKTLQPGTDNPRMKEKKGTFVTLEKKGQLRGCIGHIRAVQELYLDVRDNAINAAVNDPRFPAVRPDELDEIEIEVSVLTTPEPTTVDEIQPGKDGIILELGASGATYLPQVWEQIPDKREFLTSLCRKAGLSGDCWRDPEVKLHRYRVQAFRESEFQ